MREGEDEVEKVVFEDGLGVFGEGTTLGSCYGVGCLVCVDFIWILVRYCSQADFWMTIPEDRLFELRGLCLLIHPEMILITLLMV